MKKITLFLLLPVLAISILLSSCGKSAGNLADKIPAESNLVATFNLAQMEEKLGYESIQKELQLDQMKFALTMMGIPNFIEDRSVLGLDFTGSIYIFSVPEGDKHTVMALVPLTDSKKMEEFIKAIYNDAEFLEHGGFKYMVYEDVYFSWDKSKAVISVPLENEKEEQVLTRLKHIFNLKKTASLKKKNKRFNAFLLQKNDAAFWMDGAFPSSYAEPEMAGLDINYLKDADIIFSMNFEKGMISFRSEMHVTDSAMAKLSHWYKDPFDTKLITNIPFAEPDAFLSISLDFNALSKLIGMEKWRDQWMAKMKTESDTIDFAKAKNNMKLLTELMSGLSGNLFVGIQMNEDESSDQQVNIFGAAGFKENTPEAIIEMLENSDKAVKEAPGFYRTGKDSSVLIVVKDDVMYFLNSEISAKNIMDGNLALKGQISSEMVDKITSYPTYLFVDLQKIIPKIPAKNNSAIPVDRVKDFLMGFESIEMVSYKPEDNTFIGDFYINLMDKENYSLNALIRMIGKGMLNENNLMDL